MELKKENIPKEDLNIEYLSLKGNDKRLYKEWVCDMHSYLKELNLKHYCLTDEINILYVPNNLKKDIHNKCKSLGVLFHIKGKQTAMYKGYYSDERELVGFTDTAYDFVIEETEDRNVDEIFYTMERKL